MKRGLNMCKLFGFELFIWFLVLLKNVPITVEYDYLDMHLPEKQMSLETCLGRFDVHSNTIIRTGESQAIGGKFLQGLELETPDKCQRLCCETVSCDVYVFEEKNGGYCYLFQCGSPRNFHCKFTRHPNYTSALLTQYKPMIPTTPKPISHGFLSNISAQERELISLKLKPDKSVVLTTSAPIEVVTSESRQAASVVVENRNLTCGRFEFPCHSGECIAIYNACNGIPQCVDGSDEGPECAPANNNLKPSNHLSENQKTEAIQQAQVFRDNQNKFPSIGVDVPYIDHREGSFSSPTAWVNQKVQADTQSDMDRTIFGRKSSLNIPSINLEDHIDKPYSMQREMYDVQLPALKGAFPTTQILQPTVHAPNVRWQPEHQEWQAVNQDPSYTIHEQPLMQPDQNLAHAKDEQSLRDASKAVNDNSQVQIKTPGDSKIESKHTDYADYPEKHSQHSSKSNVHADDAPRPAVAVAKTPHMTVAEQYKIIEQHLKFADHDGHSERPRGAVLSLTLGLLVTGIIVILIGCRLRTVGRRGIRHGGKGGYAPDEDFLVNGMYL